MQNQELSLETLSSNIFKKQEFAERKNIQIFSFFTIILILSPFVDRTVNMTIFLKVSLTIFYSMYSIVFLLTVLSIIPRMKLERFLKFGRDKKICGSENLIYFNDIAKFSFEEYKKELIEKYKISETLYTNHLISQIVTNSNITKTKFCFATINTVLACIAIIQLIIFFIINFWM